MSFDFSAGRGWIFYIHCFPFACENTPVGVSAERFENREFNNMKLYTIHGGGDSVPPAVTQV
jgi:hypothetical protein